MLILDFTWVVYMFNCNRYNQRVFSGDLIIHSIYYIGSPSQTSRISELKAKRAKLDFHFKSIKLNALV